MHSRAALPTPTGRHWLAALIDRATRRDYCMRTNCSTCGALPFRRALWAGAEHAAPLLPENEIADQLATLPADTSSEAMRLVIYDLYRRVGEAGVDRLAKTLADTPAGDEYRRMQAHFQTIRRPRT